MEILQNIPLNRYTTFHIGGPAAFFVYAQDDEDIISSIEYAHIQNLPILVFGGGSNALVHDDGFKGLAIRIETIGMDIEKETENYVLLKLASGEVWDDVVRFAVEQEWYGIENLSHIPGFVGAVAVQNVGAYGQEISQTLEKVEAYDLQLKRVVTLTNQDCKFGYRSSIFNSSQKGRYVILNTYLKLQKEGKVNLSYGDVKKYFSEEHPTIAQVRQAIITIRNTKFPFPDKPTTGNAGSFFRGPIITPAKFLAMSESIKQSFGEEAAEKLQAMKDRLKVAQGLKTPAAFLIELCGLKGFQIGGAQVNPPQPAIILNVTGTATAADVIAVYKEVAKIVLEKTGVRLGIEPELIGFSEAEKEMIY